jgi:hypothetical protein
MLEKPTKHPLKRGSTPSSWALIWIKETVFDGQEPADSEPHSRQPAHARAAAQCLRNKIGSERPPHKQNRFPEPPSSPGKDAQAATALSARCDVECLAVASAELSPLACRSATVPLRSGGRTLRQGGARQRLSASGASAGCR